MRLTLTAFESLELWHSENSESVRERPAESPGCLITFPCCLTTVIYLNFGSLIFPSVTGNAFLVNFIQFFYNQPTFYLKLLCNMNILYYNDFIFFLLHNWSRVLQIKSDYLRGSRKRETEKPGKKSNLMRKSVFLQLSTLYPHSD